MHSSIFVQSGSVASSHTTHSLSPYNYSCASRIYHVFEVNTIECHIWAAWIELQSHKTAAAQQNREKKNLVDREQKQKRVVITQTFVPENPELMCINKLARLFEGKKR